METCIILNADYTFLNVVDWRKAITLLVKGKTEALKYGTKVVNNIGKTVVIRIPLVMRLIKIVRTIYKTRVPFSKKNVIVRDGNVCQYCGERGKRLTIDHVVPRSKGGKTTFENCVASCQECNHKKKNRLPSEVGMYLKKQPSQPTISEFLRIKMESLGIFQTLKDLEIF